MNSLDPRLLRTLLAVMRHGSMSAAAAALGYVPSAVSQHIARLEQQVGTELLSRRPGGGVTPTAAGRALADSAARVLEDLPAAGRPEREVLAVTRPRASHPVVDDLADLLSAAVAATRDA
ncbi:LysR family transcriptional regulator [Streptomyces sp. NPDC097704]|uniref:LysR family transcriptional regulator n=1 Tax=Streptomyces sp. NPDC097704 TaxID=3157101 RepID=UPI0033209D91